MRATIIVSFFNANDYDLPKQHLQRTLSHALETGREVILAQAVLEGQEPQPVPEGCKNLVYTVPSFLFYKENLWNAAAKQAEGDCYLFLDADVLYQNKDWVEQAEKVLETHDVTQPFTKAVWLDEFGNAEKTVTAVACAIVNNTTLEFNSTHPGFGWGITKEAFDRIGGFYDLCANGSNDALFSFALSSASQYAKAISWFNDRAVFSRHYQVYRALVKSEGIKVGIVPDCEVHHQWHGTLSNRRYNRRDLCLMREPDGSDPLTRREDGIIEWSTPEAAAAFKDLFENREDDGVPPKLFIIGLEASNNCLLTGPLHTLHYRVKTADQQEGAAVYFEKLLPVISENLEAGKPILEGILSCDALLGYPANRHWKQIAETYPESKFVMYYKDPAQAALGSVARKYEFDFPKSLPKRISLYEQHLKDITDYFEGKPERLLILTDVATDQENWNALCEFLDCPLPKYCGSFVAYVEQHAKAIKFKAAEAKPHILVTGTPGAWINLPCQFLKEKGWHITWPDQDIDHPETNYFLHRNSQNIEVQTMLQDMCSNYECDLFSNKLPKFYEAPFPGPKEFLSKFEKDGKMSPAVIGGIGNWAFLDIWLPYVDTVVAVEATKEEDLKMLDHLTKNSLTQNQLEEVRDYHLNRYTKSLSGFKNMFVMDNKENKSKDFSRLEQFLKSRF